MTFIAHHFVEVILSMSLGLWVWLKRYRLAFIQEKLQALSSRRHVRWSLCALLVLFYIAGYLTRPAFYECYHGGSLGDNYNYAGSGISTPSYYTPQHFYFPWVPVQVLQGLLHLGWLHRQQPDFLERAYLLLSLPGRLFAGLGLLVFFFTLRRSWNLDFMAAWAGTFFLMTSFGYWYWSLQSNAMGTLLAFSLCAYAAITYALRRRELHAYLLAAFLLSLCVFIHISCYYWVVGASVGLLTVCLYRWRHGHPQAGTQACIFFMIAGMMGLLFYVLSAHAYGIWKPFRLIERLADYALLGRFQANSEFVKRLITGTVSEHLSLILGLLQSGEKSALEKLLIGVLLGLIFAIALSWLQIGWQRFRSSPVRTSFWVLGCAWGLCVIGFSLRLTWPQYYVSLIPGAILLILGLSLNSEIRNEQNFALPLLVATACVMFILNGFGSANVFAGEHVETHRVYRTLSMVQSISGARHALFVGPKDTYPYNFNSLTAYYHQPGKFQSITWIDPVLYKDLLATVGKQNCLILDAATYSDIQNLKLRATEWQTELVLTKSPDFPKVYVLTKL